MPVCPKCRGEYRAGITECATCHVALVAEEDLPASMTDAEILSAMSEDDLMTVFEGPLAALRPVHEKLLGEGIPAALREGEEIVTEMGLFIKLSLVVRRSDIERVAELVGAEYRESLVREGLLVQGPDHGLFMAPPEASEEGGEAGAPTEEESAKALACPACGCTDPLVDGECPDCGLFLGEA